MTQFSVKTILRLIKIIAVQLTVILTFKRKEFKIFPDYTKI